MAGRLELERAVLGVEMGAQAGRELVQQLVTLLANDQKLNSHRWEDLAVAATTVSV